MQWDATLYDQQHGFVSEFGASLIDILEPVSGEKMLDVGCGTGDLTQQIFLRGVDITGLDSSEEMITKARDKFPEIDFVCKPAGEIDEKEYFDAVFSNAVLHWIKNQDIVLKNVYNCLVKGGRFVAELGAKGNVEKIINTSREVLKKYGYAIQAATNNWYFPSAGEYATKMEELGFNIRFMEIYDRPTLLNDAKDGIVTWLQMFGEGFFKGVDELERSEILQEIQENLRSEIFQNGNWYADYKRLRFLAVK